VDQLASIQEAWRAHCGERARQQVMHRCWASYLDAEAALAEVWGRMLEEPEEDRPRIARTNAAGEPFSINGQPLTAYVVTAACDSLRGSRRGDAPGDGPDPVSGFGRVIPALDRMNLEQVIALCQQFCERAPDLLPLANGYVLRRVLTAWQGRPEATRGGHLARALAVLDAYLEEQSLRREDVLPGGRGLTR
jgi:hypothetical protein